MTVSYGCSITLSCTIDVANPSPSYYWERVSTGDSSLEINKTLSDGSLHLKDIQRSGIYQCTAHNDYGSSIQIIELSEFLNIIIVMPTSIFHEVVYIDVRLYYTDVFL